MKFIYFTLVAMLLSCSSSRYTGPVHNFMSIEGTMASVKSDTVIEFEVSSNTPINTRLEILKMFTYLNSVLQNVQFKMIDKPSNKNHLYSGNYKDNVNTIFWVDGLWMFDLFMPSSVGVTMVETDIDGYIIESDIYLNADKIVNIEMFKHVLLHELSHAIGLDHTKSRSVESVMGPKYVSNISTYSLYDLKNLYSVYKLTSIYQTYNITGIK